jgi:hypothetical protein
MILHVLIAMVAGWLQRHQQQVIAYLQEGTLRRGEPLHDFGDATELRTGERETVLEFSLHARFHVELPHLSECPGYRFVDTMRTAPHDIVEPGAEEALMAQRHDAVGPCSVVVLISR